MSGSKGGKRRGPERRFVPGNAGGEGRKREPGIDDLARIFKECDLVLPEEALQKFWTFHQLLRQRNEELDLTRIRGFESMVLKHYVDCALVPTLVDLPEPVLDIGTGAGFPGIPMKIVRPDLRVVLAESRGKKLAFLEEACQQLGLADVEIYAHKVAARFDLPVESVITRDLESMEKTLEKAAVFLERNGLVVFMKGPSADVEIQQALARWGEDFRLKQDLPYRLGRTKHQRRLIVFERVSEVHKELNTGSSGTRIVEVASAQNPKFKIWEKLLDSRGVRRYGLALVSGPKQVRELLAECREMCDAVLLRGMEEPAEDLPPDAAYFRLRPELFRRLDMFGAGSPLLVVRVPTMEKWLDRDWPVGCTLFVPFQDPGNVGAVLRSAAAFGVSRVVMLKEAAHPFHPRSLRAAGPAVFKAVFQEGPSIEDLNVTGADLVALGTSGQALPSFEFPEVFGLITGLEGPGLPERFRKASLTIPMEPGVESLNAAIATAIVLYHWKHGQPGRK